MTKKYTKPEEISDDDIFEEAAREGTKTGIPRRPPRLLFDEFWREGELAVLFGDCGVGKSVLATQIGDAITSGTSVGPLRITAEMQEVRYIDLKLTRAQVDMRYSEEAEDDEGPVLINPHKFPDDFKRLRINRDANSEIDVKRFLRGLEQEVKKTGGRIWVLDNITFLKRSNQGTREELPLIKGLDRLKQQYGLSILVLANTVRRDVTKPISLNDLYASRILCNITDSVFAIGQAGHGDGIRYIKHLHTRTSEKLYNESHVPAFRLAKTGNFLGFEFQKFSSESDLLKKGPAGPDWNTIDRIKQLADEDFTIREIAAEMEMSKTKVHRMLQMWTPPPEDIEPEEPDEETISFDFPGREEYREATRDPRFAGIYDREDPEAYALRREAYRIDLAAAEARKIYDETGTAPSLAEMLKIQAEREAKKEASELVAVEAFENAGSSPLTCPDIVKTGPMTGLKHAFNRHDKEIFIESETETGKPRVWYTFDSRGVKQKCERIVFGIKSTKIPDPNHRAAYCPNNIDS